MCVFSLGQFGIVYSIVLAKLIPFSFPILYISIGYGSSIHQAEATQDQAFK
jgi:hypothetical protein